MNWLRRCAPAMTLWMSSAATCGFRRREARILVSVRFIMRRRDHSRYRLESRCITALAAAREAMCLPSWCSMRTLRSARQCSSLRIVSESNFRSRRWQARRRGKRTSVQDSLRSTRKPQCIFTDCFAVRADRTRISILRRENYPMRRCNGSGSAIRISTVMICTVI